jgi:Uma2 family endonuclease
MATVPDRSAVIDNGYPTSDGKPMAESDWHRELMLALIQTLKRYYAGAAFVYVSGNLLVFYVRGNKRRHVSPDVFVIRGVAGHNRPNYLLWEEGKGFDLVIELTSSSTRSVDIKKKFLLYQDTLKVKEYFLFDPREDYLDPPLCGYRLVRGKFQPIRPVHNRLPSKVLGLHLERDGQDLRLYDPTNGSWLPTDDERVAEAEATLQQAETARQQAETARQQAETARQQAEVENERLRRELQELRRRGQ